MLQGNTGNNLFGVTEHFATQSRGMLHNNIYVDVAVFVWYFDIWLHVIYVHFI